MTPIPDEYIDLCAIACKHLAKGASLAMFITEMLGDEQFVVDLPEGFRLEITKLPEEKEPAFNRV
jgi:hypothetical protein